MPTVIKIDDLWKEYRLGVIGHGTLARDLQSWWSKVTGKEDPNVKIGPFLPGLETQIDGNQFWALRSINLEVKQGEILGIIGGNGAGKSTLLKILSRVTAPTRGQINVRGRIASLLEVGTGFHPELTGHENIFMNGAVLGMTKKEIKGKIDEIVSFSGIEDFIDTPVKRYSSGMYVRLAFAVAAHLEPEILVIDEVLAVGDADFQRKCLGKMGDVAGEGRTVLFVSHNIPSIATLCTKGILLEKGKIRECGDIKEIINLYMTKNDNILDFDKIVDRKGSGIIRFSDMTVYSNYESKDKEIVTGGNFYLNVKLSVNEPLDHKDIIVDIRIDSVLGNRLIWMSTSHNEKNPVSNDISFFINKFPLNEGKYSVTLCCKFKNSISDWIQNACTFDVKNLITNKQGKIIDPGQTPFVVEYEVI